MSKINDRSVKDQVVIETTDAVFLYLREKLVDTMYDHDVCKSSDDEGYVDNHIRRRRLK